DIVIRAEADLDAAGLFGVDESVRAGFSEVRLDIKLTGPESDERYDELRKTVDAHCPVLDIFQNPTPVKTTVSRACALTHRRLRLSLDKWPFWGPIFCRPLASSVLNLCRRKWRCTVCATPFT